MFLRLVGLFIFLLGVYCIVVGQVFFGVIAIIISILVFPNLEGERSGSYHDFDRDHSDHSYSFENDSGGGDSGGGGGD